MQYIYHRKCAKGKSYALVRSIHVSLNITSVLNLLSGHIKFSHFSHWPNDCSNMDYKSEHKQQWYHVAMDNTQTTVSCCKSESTDCTD